MNNKIKASVCLDWSMGIIDTYQKQHGGVEDFLERVKVLGNQAYDNLTHGQMKTRKKLVLKAVDVAKDNPWLDQVKSPAELIAVAIDLLFRSLIFIPNKHTGYTDFYQSVDKLTEEMLSYACNKYEEFDISQITEIADKYIELFGV